jgi:hypothetical protein
VIELQNKKVRDAEAPKNFDAMTGRRQHQRVISRPENAFRVLVERDDGTGARIAQRPNDNRLVPAVHAVKHPDGQMNRPAERFQFFDVAVEVHGRSA